MKWKGIDADIFSLGALLFKLVTNKWGFNISTPKDLFYKNILFKNYNCYWNSIKSQINKELSAEFKNLFINMILFKPEKRPRIKDILNDPWMKEINDLNKEEYEKLECEVINEFLKLQEKKEIKNKDNLSDNDNKNKNIKENKENEKNMCINNNKCEKAIIKEENNKITDTTDDLNMEIVIL